MPRKIVTTYSKPHAKRVVCMGDSLTNNYVWGVGSDKFYPVRLEVGMNALGTDVLCRNLGVSGEATGQMIARMSRLIQYEVPELAILYAGTNDLSTNGTTLVTNATAPTTTQFSVTAASGVRFPAGSYITINSQTVLITDQTVDLLTVSPALSGAPILGDTVHCETQNNLQVLGQYLQAAGCSRIVIVGRHYDNFSAAADTTTVQLAANQTLRGLQSAAATTLGVPYCSLYTYMANLITTAVDTQGSFSWHVFDSNIHLNAYGEQIVADAVKATIQAQTGWITALS